MVFERKGNVAPPFRTGHLAGDVAGSNKVYFQKVITFSNGNGATYQKGTWKPLKRPMAEDDEEQVDDLQQMQSDSFISVLNAKKKWMLNVLVPSTDSFESFVLSEMGRKTKENLTGVYLVGKSDR